MVSLGIADDEPDILRLFRIMLGSNGFTIAYLARDGAEAIEKHRQAPADVVFMDYRMPSMDGIEASKAILGEFPGTRVFLMTGGEDVPEDLSNITIIKKPFTFRTIVDMLKSGSPFPDYKRFPEEE